MKINLVLVGSATGETVGFFNIPYLKLTTTFGAEITNKPVYFFKQKHMG